MMGPLERMIHLRDAVNGLCAAIDAGEVIPTEPDMLALALVVQKHCGLLTHELLCKLASRCKNGSKALTDMAH